VHDDLFAFAQRAVFAAEQIVVLVTEQIADRGCQYFASRTRLVTRQFDQRLDAFHTGPLSP
jgi:hypothetical protein